MKRTATSVLVALAVAWGVAAFAQTKPNFSGTWVAVSGSPEAIGEEVLIKQEADTITIGHGGSVEHSSTYRLDGREVKQPNLAHGSETDTALAKWDGDKIVIVVKLSNGAQHTRTLALQADGTMVMEANIARPGQPPMTIKAVHKKK